MRIVNLLDRDSQSIEKPLILMAASADRSESFCGQKLLDLVQYLQAQGPSPQAHACRVHHELWLSPIDGHDSASRVSATVWVDWQDYAPYIDGLPQAHYRLRIKRRNIALTEDVRAATSQEVEQAIHKAFDWTL